MSKLYGYITNTEEEPKLTANWDKNGKLYYTDTNGNISNNISGLSFFDRLTNKAQAKTDNINRWLNETNPESKAYKQKANVVLSLATLPLGLGKTGTQVIGNMLKPLLGNKIGLQTAQGLSSGFVSGGVEGLGRGLIDGENPLKTAALDSTIGMLGGGVFGLGFGKLGQNIAFRNLYKNQGNKQSFDNYAVDYIEGLKNYYKPLANFRAAKQVIRPKNTTTETTFDRLNPRHRLQADLINEHNPAPNSYHTWIRNADDEFDYNKVIQRVDKMKAPKPIETTLKNEGEIVIMKGSEPYKEGEQNYILNEITTNKNEQFLKDGSITIELPIYNPQKGEKGYFIHTIIKDKNGYKFNKVKSKDETIFD